jgi:hypothetical protein
MYGQADLKSLLLSHYQQWSFGGINPCLSSWKSVETDFSRQPEGLSCADAGLQPTEKGMGEQLPKIGRCTLQLNVGRVLDQSMECPRFV